MKSEIVSIVYRYKIEYENKKHLEEIVERLKEESCADCIGAGLVDDKVYSYRYKRIESYENMPVIVCLCGSTKFSDAFKQANLQETLAGKIVLSIGCDFKSNDAKGLSKDVKKQLDKLHLRKIDIADEVLILNVDNYIGESTKKELAYAKKNGKVIRYWEDVDGKM